VRREAKRGLPHTVEVPKPWRWPDGPSSGTCSRYRPAGRLAASDWQPAYKIGCRVLGGRWKRGLAAAATGLGATRLIRQLVATDTNGQVAGMYPRLGFSEAGANDQRWQSELSQGTAGIADWIERVTSEDADT
jgi:hypothetical protein